MKILKLCFCSLFLSLLISCSETDIDWSGYSEGTTTSSAKKSSIPNSIPANAIISFNPTITLVSELSMGSTVSAIYENDVSGSTFPYANETIQVTASKMERQIKLTFNINGKPMVLEIDSFLDLGDDGYYDEFNVKVTFDGKDLGEFGGRFAGNQKPKNSSKSNIEEIKTGAPTEKQFQDLLTDKAFLTVDNDGPSDVRIVSMKRSGEFIISYPSYPTLQYTYEYEYNEGNPRFTVNLYENDTVNSAQITIELKFTNFYEGTYKWILITENGNQSSADEIGTFAYYSDIDAALKAINN